MPVNTLRMATMEEGRMEIDVWGQTREQGLVSLSLKFKAVVHRKLLNQQYVLFGRFEKSIWEPMLKAKRIHTNMFTCWA